MFQHTNSVVLIVCTVLNILEYLTFTSSKLVIHMAYLPIKKKDLISAIYITN